MNVFGIFVFLFVLCNGQPPNTLFVPEVLLHAIESKRFARVERLLTNNSIKVEDIEKYPISALNIAIQRGYDKIAEMLIDYGVSPLTQDRAGRCALHVAASTGNIRIIDKICERARTNNSTLVAVIEGMEDNAGKTPLLCAAECTGRIQAMEKFLKLRADVDAVNRVEQTPLHVAVRNGDMVMIDFLLSKGADPTAADKMGVRPLDLATDVIVKQKLQIAARNLPKKR